MGTAFRHSLRTKPSCLLREQNVIESLFQTADINKSCSRLIGNLELLHLWKTGNKLVVKEQFRPEQECLLYRQQRYHFRQQDTTEKTQTLCKNHELEAKDPLSKSKRLILALGAKKLSPMAKTKEKEKLLLQT